MIGKARAIIKNAILGITPEKEVVKAAGTHVYRPVMNNQAWADWAAASGVPNPRSAEDLKVSVLHILGEYKLIPNDDVHTTRTESCVFGIFGGKFVAIWYDYGYYDRHWTLRDIVGYDSCVSCRAMLVLSDDPGDYVPTDDQLRLAPKNIVLNGELSETLDTDTVNIVKSAPKDPTQPAEELQAKAKAALIASFEQEVADPSIQARLYEISKGKPFDKAEAVEELGADVAAEIGLTAEPISVKPVEKSEHTVRKIKSDEDQQIIYVWASVTSKDGEEVVDFHDDTIANKALHDACHLIVKGARAGAFEHDGNFVNEIVSAVVLDKDMQKALSAFSTSGDIELDREGLLIGIHVPDAEHWAEVKDQNWEASINATAFVEERA